MKLVKLSLLAGVALIAGGVAQAPAQASTEFVPHRAFYKMKLASSSSQSSIVDVEGRMAFEWRDDCDSWTVEQRYIMRYFSGEQNVSEVDTKFATWESKDGKRYRFHTVNNQGDKEAERIEGQAKSDRSDGTGLATFSRPETVDFDLPADTLFPSAHTFALLKTAMSGGRFFSAPMFDGSEVEGATPISAVIGNRKSGKETQWEVLGGDYWPVRIAYFDTESTGSAPDYEMSIDMHANGIASHIVLDYGDITIDVTLEELTELSGQGC